MTLGHPFRVPLPSCGANQVAIIVESEMSADKPLFKGRNKALTLKPRVMRTLMHLENSCLTNATEGETQATEAFNNTFCGPERKEKRRAMACHHFALLHSQLVADGPALSGRNWVELTQKHVKRNPGLKRKPSDPPFEQPVTPHALSRTPVGIEVPQIVRENSHVMPFDVTKIVGSCVERSWPMGWGCPALPPKRVVRQPVKQATREVLSLTTATIGVASFNAQGSRNVEKFALFLGSGASHGFVNGVTARPT